MSIHVKNGSTYAEIRDVFVKTNGSYSSAAGLFVKITGVYTDIIDVGALKVLAKFGADAHMWMPGVGYVNGVTANNFVDFAGTVAASVDGLVGNVSDVGGGSVTATQSLDIKKPTLKLIDGAYAWQFDGTLDYLSLSSPVFQMSDEFCVVAGVSLTSTGSEKAIFAQSNGSNHALPEFMFNASGKIGAYAFGLGATVSSFDGPNNAGVGPIVATMISKANTISVNRNGIFTTSINISGTYATATTSAIGAYPTLSIGEYMHGEIYPVIAIKGNVLAEDIVTLEKFIASCANITI